MMITSRIKRWMHRDICTDPVLHGLVLNLYLNGEEYPHRVEDYFPMVDDLEPELATRMRAHLRDEDKHVALYRKAVAQLEQPVVELPVEDVFNHVIRCHTPASFSIAQHEDVDTRRLKLAHFLAHLHFLETRVAQSLEYHREGCEHSPSSYPAKVVGVILEDERRHAEYTREAVYELLPRERADRVLGMHRSAERKANLDFSHRQFSRLLHTHRERFPGSRHWLYRASTLCLREVYRHA